MVVRGAVILCCVAVTCAYVVPGSLPSLRRAGAVGDRVGVRMQMNDGKGPLNAKPSQLPDIARAAFSSLARFGVGNFVSGYRAEFQQGYKNPTADLPVKEFSTSLPSIRPKQPLILYEFEACPFCRKVREALSMLDVDAIIYPCPSQGTRFRPKVNEMGGKTQFPYIIDPNTNYQGYESDSIVKYLFQTYGDGIVPLELAMGPLTTLSVGAASVFRMGKGGKTRAPENTVAPEKPLQLWGEVLCELEVPYKSVTAARGSIKREELKSKEGKFQVPYLVDPNTDTSMFESADIISYLEKTYGKVHEKPSASSSSAVNRTHSATPTASSAAASPTTGSSATVETTSTVTKDASLDTQVAIPDAKPYQPYSRDQELQKIMKSESEAGVEEGQTTGSKKSKRNVKKEEKKRREWDGAEPLALDIDGMDSDQSFS